MKQPAAPVWRSDKLAAMGSSIFAEIQAWKQEAAQRGREVIDLSIGSPDRAPSLEIRELLSRSVLQEDQYTYPSSQGTPTFRKAASAWLKHRFGVDTNPETEILALMGSQDGLAHFAQAVCNPGDLAMVPDPGYPIYAGALQLAGVEPWLLPLREENGFMPDLTKIPEQIWQRTKFLLLNFPGNPIAVQADLTFFTELVALAKKHNVLIVHDAAYSEMGFDNYRPVSILQVPGASEIAVEFHSFSKSFHMAGCRIAFLAGNAEAVGALRDLKSNIDYGVFLPVQLAAAAALEHTMASGTERETALLYEKRRDVFTAALEAAGWTVKKPKATMFIWAKLPEAFRQDHNAGDSRQFARKLLLSTGVAVVPGIAFGQQGEGYVRIALVQEAEVLTEAAARIGAFLLQEADV
ncbi:aminotransferase class I/II-fold pyridoxal phosphate-dependent enzyme [Paenibacillus sp. F411]|uniref:aminotransferase class I/II-fold pyridoxal phosphate-dependent enzyme n=1 Tax=Paenibacillus sp. F411 TaxID=2820239 RepID=UPI001AAF87CE|nr:aminotransferase class I/II-fold pyridoxal phosphate-dependent enzyme [Paenibacillus sp. F411]MBO2943351.1 aminotransferase class I/II-fold pyridoxal phosphate-dependent enzyme [Paenibacillus sp. F411]